LTATCGAAAAGSSNDGSNVTDAPEVLEASTTADDLINSGAELAPQALTRMIHRAATIHELLDLVEAHSENLNDIHMSTAFMTLARSAPGGAPQLRPDPRFGRLLDIAEAMLPSLGAQTCVNVVWAFAKIRHHPGEQFIERLAGVIECNLNDMWPQNLANVLWAYAALHRSRRSAEHARKLVGPIARHLEVNGSAGALSPVEIANSLWSLGRLRERLCENGWKVWSAAAVRKANFFKPEDLVRILWACAVMRSPEGAAPLELVGMLLDASSRRAKAFSARQVASVLWACRRLQQEPSSEFLEAALITMEAALVTVDRGKEKLAAEEVTRAVWGCQGLQHHGHLVEQLLHVLVGAENVATGTSPVEVTGAGFCRSSAAHSTMV